MTTGLSAEATDLVDRLVAAIETRPGEARSFCIPDFNGPDRVVIHKGLPGGNTQVTRGLLDEVVQARLLSKVEPFNRKHCLYVLTDLVRTNLAARAPAARVGRFGRRAMAGVVAVIALLAAVVGVLGWAGVHPWPGSA